MPLPAGGRAARDGLESHERSHTKSNSRLASPRRELQRNVEVEALELPTRARVVAHVQQHPLSLLLFLATIGLRSAPNGDRAQIAPDPKRIDLAILDGELGLHHQIEHDPVEPASSASESHEE